MKSKIKILVLIIFCLFNLNLNAQDTDKIVTIVVSGSGKTQEEAKQFALRSAIEQAFGTFISSKTEILNDNLVKDEIISVANGNIQKYEIISEVQIPNGLFSITLNVTVSVTKLNSYVSSKGVQIEFQGALFGANLKQQKLNEEAELKALINLCEVSNVILENILQYSIKVNEPTRIAGSDLYEVSVEISATPELKNFYDFISYFKQNIKGISMSLNEQQSYQNLKKDIYCFFIDNEKDRYFFRNKLSALVLQNFFLKSNKFIHDFEIVTNIESSYPNFDNEFWKNNINKSAGFPCFGFLQPSWETVTYGVISGGMVNSAEYYSALLGLNIKDSYLLEHSDYYLKNLDNYIENKTIYSLPYTVQKMRGSFGEFKPKKIGENYSKIEDKLINFIGVLYTTRKSYVYTDKLIYTEEQISKLSSISVKKKSAIK